MRNFFGLGGIGVLVVVCCAGLPLLVAVGLSAAAFAWIGGLAAIGVVALAAVLLIARARRADRLPR